MGEGEAERALMVIDRQKLPQVAKSRFLKFHQKTKGTVSVSEDVIYSTQRSNRVTRW